MSTPDTMTTRRCWIAKSSRCASVAAALWAVATPAMANEWIQTLPSLWVSATALSLTLVAAAGRSKK